MEFGAIVNLRLFRRCCHYVLCDAYGMRGIDVVLKLENVLLGGIRDFFSIHCYVGLRLLYWRGLALMIFMLCLLAFKCN